MTFPASERVVYATHPLEEVICQLRFPPILRIDSGDVSAFQEALRGDYPLYAEEELPIAGMRVPAEFAEMMRIARQGPKPAKKFISADEQWTIALTREFVALSTSAYDRWEGFRDRLTRVVETVVDVYRPAFYTRVGLRYQDVIRRSRLGLQDVPWSELLAPSVAGELGTTIAGNVKEMSHVALIALAESGNVRIRHEFKQPDGGAEESYKIDADFFISDRIELGHANERLDYFNQQAARLFRWSITDRLHTAMGPRAID